MTRAHDLLPIPPRGAPEVYAGMEMRPAQQAAVTVEERFATGEPPVRGLVYRPRDANGTLLLILELHGGACFILRADTVAAMCASYAMLGRTVALLVYRPAP